MARQPSNTAGISASTHASSKASTDLLRSPQFAAMNVPPPPSYPPPSATAGKSGIVQCARAKGYRHAPKKRLPPRRPAHQAHHQGAGLGCTLWIRSIPASSSSLRVNSRLARLLSSCSRLVAPMMLLVRNGRLLT
ncbi:hypothetical protein D3C80_459210 [compost metagenome]